MCGSLLSKFKGPNSKIDPAIMIFPERQRLPSQMKFTNEDSSSACLQDKMSWKEGDRNGEPSDHSLAKLLSKSSLKDEYSRESDSSAQDDAARAFASEKDLETTGPCRNHKAVRLPVVSLDQQFMDTAREILSSEAYGASSSSNTVRAVQPLSSTDSTLPGKVNISITFDIPTGDKKTIYPSARVPMRLRKRRIAPKRTLEDVKEKMRAAEERKLKRLQRIRERARSRAAERRPHPAEASAQATATRIGAEQAAAESKRNEEIAKRKQARNKASRNRSRIVAAQAFAKTQLQSSIEQKAEKTEQRKMKQQQKIDRQKKLRQNFLGGGFRRAIPLPFNYYPLKM
ncbi:uncharacterized protein LOC144652721 [Oculina patagonica]